MKLWYHYQFYRDKKNYKILLWITIHKKLDNLDDIEKFLEVYSLQRWTHEATENLNRSLTTCEI